MEEYRRRLERIQINICVVLTLALFAGLLILPRIGQIIWTTIIAAVYIRLILVIARREKLLEELHPMRDDDERTAWYDASERRIFLSDSKGTWTLGIDARSGQLADPYERNLKRAEAGRRVAIERPRTSGVVRHFCDHRDAFTLSRTSWKKPIRIYRRSTKGEYDDQ